MPDSKLLPVAALLTLAAVLAGCSANRHASVHARQERDALQPVTGSRIHNVDRKGNARTSSMVLVVDKHAARCILQPYGC